mmetsp:Transcript_42876/g.50282  ORF Transcript_42876/g.50282 Transcript_42876/m.50282 type:complete len:131 (-) Transcript_42876:33-425(-)|eukprot:CAMPEP_0168325406 /NCGR_PEP_ID=MMETSP0213-20121227/4673_1 /TAXON_ID=151035 /ORGANISM="Euplotes harpa, Strain FSP1.4" /LENGTH=130 /DNA_ID=CAMNT_0008327893 /DNA_START=1038 /DNA_END=1430 /DNA_ORIENTATION=-
MTNDVDDLENEAEQLCLNISKLDRDNNQDRSKQCDVIDSSLVKTGSIDVRKEGNNEVSTASKEPDDTFRDPAIDDEDDNIDLEDVEVMLDVEDIDSHALNLNNENDPTNSKKKYTKFVKDPYGNEMEEEE